MNELFDVRRSQDGNQVLKSLNGQIQSVVEITDATYSVEDYQSGSIFALNKAAGMTITLPSAESGMVFEFYVADTFTGTLQIDADSASDTLQGVLSASPSLTGTATNAGDTTAFVGPAAADHQFIANADTKGRVAGTRIKYQCVSDSKWLISGHLVTIGTVATPFS